jgi:hypothetical protein
MKFTNDTFAELNDPTTKYGKQYQEFKKTEKKPLDLTGPSTYDPSKNKTANTAWGPLPEVDTSWALAGLTTTPNTTVTSNTPTSNTSSSTATTPTTTTTIPTISRALTPTLTDNTISIPEFTAKKTSLPASYPYIAKTIDPKLADINYTTTVDILKKISNYVNLFPQLEKEIQISLDYYTALQNNDVVGSLGDFYSKLNSEKMPILRNDFVDFWVKRYQITAQPLKTLITFNIDTSNQSFFTELSDSIGILVNSNCLLDDSTIPFTDYTTGLYTAPNVLPVQLRNKVSKTTLEVATDLSEMNTILMRNNLAKINLTTKNVNPYTNPTSNPAHGINLITDIHTFDIIKNNLSTYFDRLKSSYSRIFNYVQYVSNINNINGYNPRDTAATGTNQQIITDILFGLNVEKFTVSMDILQRKFKYLLSYKTNENTLSNPRVNTGVFNTGVTNFFNITNNLNVA